MMSAIQTLLQTARQNQQEVIFVRHQSDNEPLKPDSQGWQNVKLAHAYQYLNMDLESNCKDGDY